MIIFSFGDAAKYFERFPALGEALKKYASLGVFEPGRYELEDGYFMLQEGTAVKDDMTGLFESHTRYIDIQIVLEGEEYVSWRTTAGLEPCGDASLETLHYEGQGKLIRMCEGDCYVFFPDDAHKACLRNGEPTSYKKLVVKCPV